MPLHMRSEKALDKGTQHLFGLHLPMSQARNINLILFLAGPRNFGRGLRTQSPIQASKGEPMDGGIFNVVAATTAAVELAMITTVAGNVSSGPC